jgi:hypothetical protein
VRAFQVFEMAGASAHRLPPLGVDARRTAARSRFGHGEFPSPWTFDGTTVRGTLRGSLREPYGGDPCSFVLVLSTLQELEKYVKKISEFRNCCFSKTG